MFMKRTMSTVLPAKQSLNNSPSKEVKQTTMISKSRPQSNSEHHLNLENCLYLKKYNRMLQLQLKPFSTFEADHKGFI